MTVRGIANNNPLNIRYTGTPWQGMDDPPSDRKPLTNGMIRFQDMVWGLRAASRTLISYQDKHDIRSVWDAIHRWAPAADNNDPVAYAGRVARLMGVDPKVGLDLHAYDFQKPMIQAMTRVECGLSDTAPLPYDDRTLDEALRRAGVMPEGKKPLSQSREMKTGGGLLGAGGGLLATEAVQLTDQTTALQDQANAGNWIGVAIGVAVLALGAYVIWNRYRARQAGER